MYQTIRTQGVYKMTETITETVKNGKMATIQRAYNRSTREYDLVNMTTGEVVDRVPGKREAFQRSIQIASQAVYSLALTFAEFAPLESRAWKAAEIVVRGGVEVASATLALVDGNSEYGRYNVEMVDGLWECDCADFTENGAVQCIDWQARCKHIVAVEIEFERQRMVVDSEFQYA